MKFILRPLLLLVCLLNTLVHASDVVKAVPEYDMKAVYLYNFAQLTDWPAESTLKGANVFTVCVFAQSQMVLALEKLRNRMVNGKPLKILSINGDTEVNQCQLLFVGEDESDRGRRLFQQLRGTPVLTVTDDPQGLRQGAMLTIVPDQRRLAFEVNLEPLNQSQLRLSSRLLHLAQHVAGK